MKGASTTRPRLPEKYFLPLRERERERERDRQGASLLAACARERRARREGGKQKDREFQDIPLNTLLGYPSEKGRSVLVT